MIRSLAWVVVLCLVSVSVFAAEWKPQPAPLMTKWAADVKPEAPLPEYPRPQMVRENWKNLNGLWDYAIRPKSEGRPEKWDGEILVPFPVESSLSGVMKLVGPDNKLWYRRSFSLPQQDGKTSPAWDGKNILLHFGAVDWETTVWLNGKEAGTHKGGYDPFSFDITSALKPDGPQELVVSVWDGSDSGFQPRGKQVRKPGGIWYTPATGIWQTVWIEPVGQTYVTAITARAVDLKAGQAEITIELQSSPRSGTFTREIVVIDEGKRRVLGAGGITRTMESPAQKEFLSGRVSVNTNGFDKQWSPDTPFLYGIEFTESENGQVIERVTSHLAMRTISLGKDDKGINRILLNGKPLFQYGPLDQGFWPDGLYTAPTDEALKFDIEQTKKYGFNMIRKHVKVEPARWYYWCDKLGMLVWQDMPSGDRHAPWDPFGRHDNTEITRSPESSENYRREWKSIIDALRNHPSIVMWVPFNEGWGQSDTVAVTKWTKEYDPTRLVNCASGGNDFPVGDVIDVHRYPGPFAPKPTADRAAVLGEYGGLGLPLEGHTWQGKQNWGYRSFTDQTSLTSAYLDLLEQLHPMIASPGLSAAIYTQTTDVETEVNGLMTYDRKVMKIPVDVAAKAHRALYSPPPQTKVVVATSQKEAQTWKYTTDKPAEGWEKTAFDDASWKSGPGGFGEKTTPGSVVRTDWKTNDIWLRRTIELKDQPTGELRLLIHHDEDTEVYINGVLAAKTTGYTTDYRTVRLTKEGAAALKAGANTLALHCKQTGGGQYIDVGIVERVEVK